MNINWNDPNPLALDPELPNAGASDIPAHVTNPERGERDTLTHRFFRAVWEPYQGLVPERVRRHAERFFDRVKEARALLDLRSAAEAMAFTTRTDPSYGTAAQLWERANQYLSTFRTVGAPA